MFEQSLPVHEQYMRRCIELARLGPGKVAPNPMVGAVLVNNGRIIGEGYHKKYGEAHAEVNCIDSVSPRDRKLISSSVLYVSLEPCAHFGKTPPCTELILKHKIPKVIIGTRDPFPGVNGKGVAILKDAGVSVESGILSVECKALNKRFFTFHLKHRPYVILKWAQTNDGFMAGPLNPSNGGTLPRLFITNDYSNRLVHKWRMEEEAILVGTNTALLDDPALTNRFYEGRSPLRLVIDMDLRLPSPLKLFNAEQPTIVFNSVKHEMNDANLSYYQVTPDVSIVHQVLNALYQMKIQSLLVEGGAQLLQSFIDDGSWDEARVITNTELNIKTGLAAPLLGSTEKVTEQEILGDQIQYYKRVDS